MFGYMSKKLQAKINELRKATKKNLKLINNKNQLLRENIAQKAMRGAECACVI